MDFASYIRNVPNFPKQGIMFRDITTLLKDPIALHAAAERLYELSSSFSVGKVVGVESRGFILGSLLALKHNAGFVPIRKPGKLPAETYSHSYSLEYGTDTIEMHVDAIQPGEKVLIHDDLLATGGTIEAAVKLVEKAGGEVVFISFLIELAFLPGKDKLKDYQFGSLVTYDSE